jgi:hypothetical protein
MTEGLSIVKWLALNPEVLLQSVGFVDLDLLPNRLYEAWKKPEEAEKWRTKLPQTEAVIE